MNTFFTERTFPTETPLHNVEMFLKCGWSGEKIGSGVREGDFGEKMQPCMVWSERVQEL